MADQTTLMGLLKTPSQIRKESQERLMQESLARSQQMLTRGGSTALPGIISAYGAQAAQRGAQAGAGLLRGVTGGIGQAVGGDMGQRISALGIPAEERQAAMQQEALRGVKFTDIDSIKQAANKLRTVNPQAALRLDQMAATLASKQKAPNIQEIKEGDEIVTYAIGANGTRVELARSPRFESKAPQTRTRIDGDNKIVEQWNPETETYTFVSKGPRYEPTDPAEISAAVYKGSQEKIVDKAAMDYFIESYAENNKAVESARKTFVTTDQMRTLVDEGILTGAFADFALPAAKLLVQIGAIDSETVENTEQFIKTAARQTVALLASGVFGTAQSITDNDRKFAEGMAGGDIALTENTIRTLIDMNEYYATLAFEQQQRGVNQARQAFPESERVTNIFNPMYYDGQQFDYPIMDSNGRPTGEMGIKEWDERSQSFIEIPVGGSN